MLQEWKKAKNIFKKPKLRVYFGFWSTPHIIVKLGSYLFINGFDEHPLLTKVWNFFSKTDPSLPVWRRGNFIRPFRKQQVYDKGEYIWNNEFKKKLDQFHLGWLNCVYKLPIWLSCHIFKYDMSWKWKYDDDVRYEFPPQFTIVLFNISLTLHWHAPVGNDCLEDNNYWESILNWNYKQDIIKRDILRLGKYMGISRTYSPDRKEPKYKCILSPLYLKDQEWAHELNKKEAFWLMEAMKKDKFLKCECGGYFHLDEDKVLLTSPVQFEYTCSKCGKKKYSGIKYNEYSDFDE